MSKLYWREFSHRLTIKLTAKRACNIKMSSMKIGANSREEIEEVKIGRKTPFVDSSGQAYLSVLVLAERRPECENEDEARESGAGQNEQPLDGGDFDDPEDRDGYVDEE